MDVVNGCVDEYLCRWVNVYCEAVGIFWLSIFVHGICVDGYMGTLLYGCMRRYVYVQMGSVL